MKPTDHRLCRLSCHVVMVLSCLRLRRVSCYVGGFLGVPYQLQQTTINCHDSVALHRSRFMSSDLCPLTSAL
jgi:hypothetical protein